MKKIILLICVLPTLIFAQKWQRSEPVETDLNIFSATHAFSLPTTESLQKNDFYFMMGHRFVQPVSDGFQELYGLDGGVVMRIALAYAITDNLMINAGRSNLENNYDFQLKYKAFEFKNDFAPIAVSFLGAGAYNGQPFQDLSDDSRRWQAFGLVILNTQLFGKLNLGLAPGFLYNAHIYCDNVENSITLGTYASYSINQMWGLVAEYNPTLNGWRDQYDSFSFGTELETGGHFFKFFVSNNTKTNLSQFLAGSSAPIRFDDLHICFQITRNL